MAEDRARFSGNGGFGRKAEFGRKPGSTPQPERPAPVQREEPHPQLLSVAQERLYQRDSERDSIESDLATFFGPRAERYLSLFKKIPDNSPRSFVISWNWGAFFLTFVWFFFRKQYRNGVLVLCLPAMTTFVVKLMGIGGGSSGLAVAVFSGVMADTLYIRHALKRVERADGIGLTGQERRESLRRAGGVSWMAGSLAVLALLAILAFATLALYVEYLKQRH